MVVLTGFLVWLGPGAGGVLRDSNGQWVSRFVVNLGQASCVVEEAWGLLYGLIYARDLALVMCKWKQIKF